MKDNEYQHIWTNQTKLIKRRYALLCLWLASTFYAKMLGQNYFAKSNQYVLEYFSSKVCCTMHQWACFQNISMPNFLMFLVNVKVQGLMMSQITFCAPIHTYHLGMLCCFTPLDSHSNCFMLVDLVHPHLSQLQFVAIWSFCATLCFDCFFQFKKKKKIKILELLFH